MEVVALGIDYGSKTSGFTAAASYSSAGTVQIYQSAKGIIMQKLQTGDFVDGDAAPSLSEMKSTLDPKVIEAYKKVGVVMRSFKSGKLPKAFKIIP